MSPRGHRPLGPRPRARSPDRHVLAPPQDPRQPGRDRGRGGRQLREDRSTLRDSPPVRRVPIVLCPPSSSGSAGGTPAPARRRPRAQRPRPDRQRPPLVGQSHGRRTAAVRRVRWPAVPRVKADTVATSSTTCDGCAGESTALHVVYLPRAGRPPRQRRRPPGPRSAGCTSTALSVQVVVLRGPPVAVPNNRALALNAACTSCRTSALAFQVVLVADGATALSDEALAELRHGSTSRRSACAPQWLRPRPSPRQCPRPRRPPRRHHPPPRRPTGPPQRPPARRPRTARRIRRDAVSALGELEQLLVSDLGAQTLSADIEMSR